LELSPAFESDKLITVELSRNANGGTMADCKIHTWKPDKAIAA
jgi:exonuclease SbcC